MSNEEEDNDGDVEDGLEDDEISDLEDPDDEGIDNFQQLNIFVTLKTHLII